jgi:hypothetical protein
LTAFAFTTGADSFDTGATASSVFLGTGFLSLLSLLGLSYFLASFSSAVALTISLVV